MKIRTLTGTRDYRVAFYTRVLSLASAHTRQRKGRSGPVSAKQTARLCRTTISKAHPCRRRTRGSGTRRTTTCQAPGEGRGLDGAGGRGGGGCNVAAGCASVLVAGRGARAHAMHEGLVGLALAALGPPLAALVVVVAHRHADLRRVAGRAQPVPGGFRGTRRRGGAAARRRGGAGRRWARRGAPRTSPGTPSSPRGGC